MASSFIDNEKRSVDNGAFQTDPESSTTDLLLYTAKESISDTDTLGNLSVTASDVNVNILVKNNENSTTEFLANEIGQTSATNIEAIGPDATTSGKRKRDDSPESCRISIPDDIEESVAHGLESDLEGDTSDVHLKTTPPASQTDVSVKSSIDDLPDTVTVLGTCNGGKIYLVGTAHFSQESQEDVSKVIRAVQPHIVLVELCKARTNILQLDEETILEEAKNINFDKIRSTIRQNGLIQGVMYLLLLSTSAHLTKQLGMAPGGEFRRAFAEARNVPQCLIHLGDRPIDVTLHRALSSLSWWQTARLAWHLFMYKDSISKEEVERCKRKDLLEEMLAEMTVMYPALSTVFVTERDIYLIHSLQLAASTCPAPARVVGVVGIGHVPGIIENWKYVTPDDIPPLLEIPPPSLTSKVLRFGVKASVVGLVIWGCYRYVPYPRFLPTLDDLKASVQSKFQ